MKVISHTYIEKLKGSAQEIITDAQELKKLTLIQLQQRPHENSWSALECIEHMNLYHEYYLPEIEKQITSSNHPTTPEFKAGWFGNYSALNMLPKKKGKVNMPMKTFKNMNPHGQSVKLQVLDTFISQMKELMSLLEASKEVDLRKTKCTLTLRWMKFTLGDTLHFMINHNIRHMIQIKKIFAPISA